MTEDLLEDSLKESSKIAEKFEVKLCVQLTEKKMTLKDICLLKEGDIIELDARVDEPLKLTVNNKAIGTAELIQIEDRLGIRITSIDNYD